MASGRELKRLRRGDRKHASALPEPSQGVIFLLIAHLIWGAMAYYLKQLDHISPVEIAVHRGLWSLPFAFGMLVLVKDSREALTVLRSPRTLAILAFCSALIVFNWAIYVWAIQMGRTAEAALGYYVNPLMNVSVGYFFLHERFNRTQGLALVLVASAVVVQTIAVGAFPWLGLSLAATFCLYGYIRKMVPVTLGRKLLRRDTCPDAFRASLSRLDRGPRQLGIPFVHQRHIASDRSRLLHGLDFHALWCGVKRVRYSTVGLLQYISPSIVFLIAVFIFHEPMNPLRWLSFVLIWIGLAIFSFATVREDRLRRATSVAEPV